MNAFSLHQTNCSQINHSTMLRNTITQVKKPPLQAVMLMLLMLLGGRISAQAPTALQYPTPTVAIAGVTSVFMSPTVSSNVVSYSIAPALPAGLSFNTNNGIISGVATGSSPATTYTVTATNASGSTTCTLSIQVAKTYYNLAFDSLKFINQAGSIVAIHGDGRAIGDSMLYKNVATVGGQQIDCIVTTKGLENIYYFLAFDQEASSGSGYNYNLSRFFSPQIAFDSSYGSATFTFQPILGNSYVNAANPGIPVFLQNVKMNVYDIDGSDAAGTNQFNAISGFDSSEIGIGTKLSMAFDTTTELTYFRSTVVTNTVGAVNDSTRVRVTYNNMGYFELRVGVDGGAVAGVNPVAYFFTDFSTGPAFGATPTGGPSVDLNTSLAGVNNYAMDCTGQMTFSGGSSQTNVLNIGGPNFRQLRVSIPTAQILDGSNEQLIVTGATGTSTIPLNANPSINNLTLGGVVYSVTGTTAGGVRNFVFKRNSGNLVRANAEALLDAFKYVNIASFPTNGERKFTLSLRDSVLQSPDAVFTATVQCASISGNIYRDANALTDNTVNANSTAGQFAAAGVYAALVNSSSNAVISTQAVAAGGAYSFGHVDTGRYNIFISNTATPGATLSAATYPAGNYKSIGENLGALAGNDLSVDGKLSVKIGSVPVTNANFGVQIPPVTANTSYSNITNPGGYNYYTIPAGGFSTSDADGTVDSVIITGFPTGANYLKVGSIFYTSGGTCPPQSSCTAWPGTLKFPYSQVGTVGVDPTAIGVTSVVISYTVLDNGRAASNNGVASTITLGFVSPGITISGNVWNDFDGSATKNGSEAYTAVAASGQTLYAMLVQTSNTYSDLPTIYASTPVTAAATGYTFSNVPSGNAYEVRIVSRATAPAAGAALGTITPALATGWTDVTTSNNGTKTTYAGGTINPTISLGTVSANKTNVNFGIEQKPTADPKILQAPNSAFSTTTKTKKDKKGSSGSSGSGSSGSSSGKKIKGNSNLITGATVLSLSGLDPEDCATTSSCNTGKTFVLNAINANTTVTYDFGAGDSILDDSIIIPNFNVANLSVISDTTGAGTASNPLGFTYSLMDVAGVSSDPVVYSLQTPAPLPILLTGFYAKATDCSATLYWNVGSELNGNYYQVEQSTDATEFWPIAKVSCRNSASGGSYSANASRLFGDNYFRLKRVSQDGDYDYSKTIQLSAPGCDRQLITMSPNPAERQVMISGLSGSGNVLLVYDMMGSLIYKTITNQDIEFIDVSEYAKGTYLVQVRSSNGATLSSMHLIRK